MSNKKGANHWTLIKKLKFHRSQNYHPGSDQCPGQTYKSQVTDDSAKLVVNTDATVELPDVEKNSAISVTPAEITQDFLDRITDAFFSGRQTLYSRNYYTQTKSDIQATIDKLKEYVANGNLDPYNLGTDSNGDYEYNIYDDIEYWEESMRLLQRPRHW
ncbi:MAG: DUF6034 family protein [Blautia sp.]